MALTLPPIVQREDPEEVPEIPDSGSLPELPMVVTPPVPTAQPMTAPRLRRALSPETFGLPENFPGREDLRLRDGHGRALTDLRLSVTDRCNYRCVYCRTGSEGAQFTELPIAHYLRMLRIFVSLGVEKVRLTGGEPLLRHGLLDLIQEIARLRPAFSSAPLDIAITSNGHLLAAMAKDLKRAGLNRITVSMDAVDAETFSRITRIPNSFERVRDGIRAAQDAGLGPVKVNCVLLRGFNDSQIEAFAEFSRREQVIVRFIEFMPLEEGRSWSPQMVVPMREILNRLSAVRPLVAMPANHASETARRFTFDDGVGEIGIIAPVSEAFCGQCSRVRITSDGKLRTCLFSQQDHDLIGLMLRGATDDEMISWIRRVVQRKEARHHIGEPGFLKPSRSMVHIGG
ncbi:MAG: GTP 3',8-cyclase MoaA [Acidobacteriota bacterium]